jgi:hypothetical protein
MPSGISRWYSGGDPHPQSAGGEEATPQLVEEVEEECLITLASCQKCEGTFSLRYLGCYNPLAPFLIFFTDWWSFFQWALSKNFIMKLHAKTNKFLRFSYMALESIDIMTFTFNPPHLCTSYMPSVFLPTPMRKYFYRGERKLKRTCSTSRIVKLSDWETSR